MAARGWWPWLRAVVREEWMRQWRCRVSGVRQQPLIFAASLQPRMAFSDPLLVAGTSKRAANSQTWPALRFSLLARISPGWFPLCQRRDRPTEIPKAAAWS
jgi:hypothetical protein